MAGLSSINSRQREKANARGSDRKEIWLRDGDQVFLRPVATGEDDDPNLEELYLYTYEADGGGWKNTLVDPDTQKPMSDDVPEGKSPSHKFALWAYVSEVIHNQQRRDEWEQIVSPSGKKAYKEEVNDFRIICLPFGRGNQYWNMLVDQYDDWGSLNEGVLRVKRTGAGLDTVYSLSPVARKVDVPAGKEAEITELQPIWDYYVSQYGGNDSSEETSTEVITAPTSEKVEYVPWDNSPPTPPTSTDDDEDW
jgi:hypothetical protein